MCSILIVAGTPETTDTTVTSYTVGSSFHSTRTVNVPKVVNLYWKNAFPPVPVDIVLTKLSFIYTLSSYPGSTGLPYIS